MNGANEVIDKIELLKELDDYINKFTPYCSENDFIEDNHLIFSDRVAPEIESGWDYDRMKERIVNTTKVIQDNPRFKDKLTIEMEAVDEWIIITINV